MTAINWYPFWESFESATLTGVDKFNYLKSLLVGSAAHAIAGLPLTNANYEKAIDLLKKRFGNHQMIISSHMEALTKNYMNALSKIQEFLVEKVKIF